MKKLTGILTLGLLMATTVLLAGKPGFLNQVSLNDPEVQIVSGETPGIFQLRYQAETEAKLWVVILDEEGNLVHRESNGKQKSFSRSYDLQSLPEGTYYFEVWGKSRIARQKLEYHKVIQKMISLETETFPEDRKVNLKVKGASESHYMVRIYGASGDLLFQDKLEIDPIKGRTFNFEQAWDKEVQIVVYNDDTFADTWVQTR